MLYRIAQPVGPSARAREFGNLRAQLENSGRQRIIIHAGPASSAAPFFDIEYEIGLRAHQPLRGRGAVEVGRDQLLDFDGLKPNVAPQPGDIAIEQNEVAVHRSLRATVTGQR
jgi:hypothetical protein